MVFADKATVKDHILAIDHGTQSVRAMLFDLCGNLVSKAQVPAFRPHTYEASGLGAAIDGAVGLGLHPSFESAVREMTRVGDVFEPDPRTREIYDELYHRVYKRMYPKLRSLYQEIREITGYPA